MADAETTIERLRSFLRDLSPQARSLLVSALERAVLRGDDLAGADLVLQELRRITRDERERPAPIEHSTRLLFQPLEPFLVDDRVDHNHSGRIARPAIEPLWNWISRDLLPEESKTFSDQIGEALLAGDDPKVAFITREFQDQVVAAIESTLGSMDGEKLNRRVLAQIGTPRAWDDARALKVVLKSRDTLAAFGALLPLRINNLANDQLDECKAMIDRIAARSDELFLYSLLTVMNRLAAPWQLVRFGIKAANSDSATRVAETHYGVSVTIVLSELERLVGELRYDLRRGQGVAVGALLKTIHDAARGLRTELDLPLDSAWGRALAAQRAQIAELLRSEIESMPGRVRRLLRPRTSSEIRPNSVLDSIDIAEVEALVDFVGTCRYFAAELALNEMTQRSISELRHYLDADTRSLLDGLRQTNESERKFRQSQVEAAIRLCAKVFGKDYAALLSKAAEIAGAPDRKVIRG